MLDQAHSEPLRSLRAQMGLKIARWLMGATLLYILIFWFILSNSEASLASVITLCLHLALYPLHQRQLSSAATLSLSVALLHLAVIDLLVLHTELSIYLWMMCVPPFAVMTCHKALERRAMTAATLGLMLSCYLTTEQLNKESYDIHTWVGLTSIIGSTLLLTYITRWGLREIERSHSLLGREYKRSERLLLNVLPYEVATRLKSLEQGLHEATIADNYPEACVLFADIVGFTPLSSRLSPERLVEILNRYFIAFDQLAEEHGVEKIKTIGDAYMAATGILSDDESAPKRISLFALQMLATVKRLNQELDLSLSLRIGIHIGPVTAGVIGSKKFIYDLWGDTVNVAARMESHSEAGQIQVTAELAERLSQSFELEPRGSVEIKGKGEMETAYLKRALTEG